MTSSASNSGAHSTIEQALFECLSHPAEQWDAALERVCAASPALAPELRERFEALRATGLIDASAMSDTALPRTVGAYELLLPLGGGTMGTVFLARRLHGANEGDHVALKLLRPGLGFSPAARKRFERERSILARVEHPGIASLRDAGSADGAPFLAMEFIEGESLATVIAARAARPSADACASAARIGGELARALHAAHTAGLVHRDVKPSNVVVRPDGRAVLLDFGLALDEAEDAPRLTGTGMLVGSPAYIAPECVSGRSATVASDVYSLGVTLFEVVTGTLPYVAPTREALFRRILRDPVPSARARNPAVSSSLDGVLRAALAKRPERRYADAAALALDLEACAAGRRVAAPRPGIATHTADWARANPLATAFVVLLTVAWLATLWLSTELRESLTRTRALALSETAARATPELRIPLSLAAVELFEDPITVSELQAAVVGHRPSIAHPVQDAAVTAVVFDPSGGVVSLSAAGTARMSDAAGNPLGELARVSAIEAAGETRLVRVELESGAALWDGTALRGAPSATVRENALARSSDGTSCVVATGAVRAWVRRGADTRLDLEHPLATFPADGPRLFVPFGDRLAVLENWTTVRILAASGEVVATIPAHGVYVAAIAVSPDGSTIATGDGDGTVRLFTTDGVFVDELAGHEGHVTSVAFRADGLAIVSGSYDRGVRQFELRGGAAPRLSTNPDSVIGVDAYVDAAGREGALWVCADGTVRVWDADGERQLASGVRRAVCVEGARGVFLVRRDGSQRIVRRKRPTLTPAGAVVDLRGIEDLVSGVEGEREWVLAACSDGTLARWSGVDGAWSLDLELALDAALLSAHAAPNGTLATGDRDGFVRVLDADGTERRRFRAHDDWVRSVRFSPDGTRVLTTSRDNTARVWSATGALRVELRAHTATVARGVFSPDGARIATASTDHTARLWTADGAPLATLRGHAGQVWDVDFRDDGEWLWTASYDRTVLHWPATTATLLERARSLAPRALSAEERERYVP